MRKKYSTKFYRMDDCDLRDVTTMILKLLEYVTTACNNDSVAYVICYAQALSEE